MSFTKPDRYLKRISDIDIANDLINADYMYVLLDVDNTILTRDKSIVPKDVSDWLAKARSAGIKFCLISNDWHKNVVELAKKLNLPIVVKSLKPLPGAFRRARKKIGANKKNCIMIGDQLMTDVFGAHAVGLKCILVQPLVEKDLIHTLVLRKVERLFLRNIEPEKGKADNKNEKTQN